MPREFNEADWKVLRQLHPIALDRLCGRVLREIEAIGGDATKSTHQRYLEIYALIKRRDSDIATAFNDARRSRMVEQVMAMKRLGLITDAEFDLFSFELQRIVSVFAAHHAMS